MFKVLINASLTTNGIENDQRFNSKLREIRQK